MPPGKTPRPHLRRDALSRWWRRSGRLTARATLAASFAGAAMAVGATAVLDGITVWTAAAIGLAPLLGVGLAMGARRHLVVRVHPLPVSRAVGACLRWVRAHGIKIVLWALFVVVAAWLLDVRPDEPIAFPAPTTGHVARVVGLLLALLSLILVLQARRGVAVEEFSDYTAAVPTRTKGLAPMVMHRLDHLAELHRDVDERRAVATAVGHASPIDISISVDGDTEFLQKDFTTEDQFRVGPLAVPARFVAALAGRLARGGRITGSLHRQGDSLVLIAKTSGLRPAYAWRVERRVPAGSSGATASEDIVLMANELGARIFTDLALGRTVRWEATRSFARGLEDYRDSLTNSRNRVRNLMEAEREFLQAASEDPNFDLAFYNLGVLYAEQDRVSAAQHAFKTAIARNRARLEPYYALAVLDRELKQPIEARWRCLRVLRAKPNRVYAAAAWDLLAIVALDEKDPRGAIRPGRRAARKARGVLRRAYLAPSSRGPGLSVRRMEERLALYLENRAVAHLLVARTGGQEWRSSWHTWRAAALLRGSVGLEPASGAAHKRLGTLAPASDREAIRELRIATQLSPEDSDAWAHLALLLAHEEPGEALQACFQARRALRASNRRRIDAQACDLVSHAFSVLGQESEAERVQAIPKLLGALPDQADRAAVAHIQSRLWVDDWVGRNWERAQYVQWLAQHGPTDDLAILHARMEEAISLLVMDDGDGEIQEAGLQARLALVMRFRDSSAEALVQARRAIDIDPISAFERAIIGQIHTSLSEVDAAREAYEVAVVCSPTTPEHRQRTAGNHLGLADAFRALAANCRDPDQQDRLFSEAEAHAEQALVLLPVTATGETANARLALAVIAGWRRHFDDAVQHARIARNLASDRVLPALILADALQGKHALADARAEFAAAGQMAQVAEPDSTAAMSPDDPIDSFLDGRPVRRGEALAYARLGEAEVRLDAHVDLARARKLAQEARRHLNAVTAETQSRESLESDCLAAVAWSYVLDGRLERGVAGLESAVALYPGSSQYLRWASALEKQGDGDAARERALLARKVDLGREHGDEIDALLERLDAAGRDVFPWARATAGP